MVDRRGDGSGRIRGERGHASKQSHRGALSASIVTCALRGIASRLHVRVVRQGLRRLHRRIESRQGVSAHVRIGRGPTASGLSQGL